MGQDRRGGETSNSHRNFTRSKRRREVCVCERTCTCVYLPERVMELEPSRKAKSRTPFGTPGSTMRTVPVAEFGVRNSRLLMSQESDCETKTL